MPSVLPVLLEIWLLAQSFLTIHLKIGGVELDHQFFLTVNQQ